MSAFVKTLKKQGNVVTVFDDALWGGLPRFKDFLIIL